MPRNIGMIFAQARAVLGLATLLFPRKGRRLKKIVGDMDDIVEIYISMSAMMIRLRAAVADNKTVFPLDKDEMSTLVYLGEKFDDLKDKLEQ